MISRCSSPMPAIMVCPLSWSVETLNVGSSSASLASASEILSLSACVFGSTAIRITGSGKTISSSSTGLSGSQSVSPVRTCFRPTAAKMSPAFDLIHILSRVSVHEEEATNALLLARADIQYLGTLLERARVNASERELTDVRVGHDLERDRRERLIRIGAALDMLTRTRIGTGNRRHIGRARQIVNPHRRADAEHPCS